MTRKNCISVSNDIYRTIKSSANSSGSDEKMYNGQAIKYNTSSVKVRSNG
jgi:hypothetical protein